jgi:hypothetical protein
MRVDDSNALMVSQPGDASEAEADRIAAHIVSMPEPGPRAAAGGRAGIQRSPLIVQRAPAAPAPIPENVADPATEAAVKKELSGGAPMAPDVAGFFGRRFRADFSGVRIHTDGKAANLSTRLGARAFTYGRHVFFNAGQYNPDTEAGSTLIAHELTHTIQQQAAIQLKEAEAPRVNNRSERRAQRGIVSKALNWIADKANYIPGFRLFTIVIGLNPINMSTVERSGANILRALIEFIPGGGLIVDALNNHGIFEKGGKFIEDQFRSLGMVGAAFRDALMEFVDSLGLSDIFHLGDLWDRAKRIFTAPVDKLISFGKGLVTGIATIVKDAILKPLGRYAAKVIPKWDLLVGVFGKNPVSDEGQSPAAALIGAFMELIGQKEVWDNIQKSGAVGKAWAWFQGALSGALALVKSIPGRFVDTLKSLTIFDIVTIVGAWVKFAKLFGSFVVDFISWAGGKVLKLLEIILEVLAPSVIPYLKKAGGAFNTIIKAPGRFIGTLVRAGKAGFNNFKTNIVKHLRDALFKWLLGSAEGAGVYFPQSFAPRELLKMGLSVLGLTWANLRGKLVAATNETTVKALEEGFAIVKTLVTDGPAAAWKQLLESLSSLKAMVVDAAIDFVKGEVVRIAIEKLVSFLTPAGAFIQAILSIYRTITFIVNKLADIGRVVAAFIDGIAAIAAGNIAPAAAKVEAVLASGMSLAISFLANFAGLGNIPKKVMDLIKKIRAPVDKAMDTVIGWIVAQAKKVGTMILQAGVPSDPLKRTQLAIRDAKIVAKGLGGKPITKGILETALSAIKTRYSLSALTVFQKGKAWWASAEINPKTAEEIAREKDEDLAKRIRVIADQKVAALKVKKAKGDGTHDSPIVMPAGSGIVTIAKQLDEVPLARGKIVVIDTAQGNKGDQRAVVQRPAFGDAIVSGATSEEKRIEIGKYTRVVEEIRKRFGSNDAKSASIIMGILEGMPIPANMQQHAGWIGGLKTLAAQEIRRDPVAAITLPANIALASAGKKDLDQVFINSVQNRGGTGSQGGDFSQSVVGANAIMRGARDKTGIGNPQDAPASRGTAAKVAGAIAVDAATVTELAKVRLKTKNEPSNDEIAGVVEEEIQKVLK